VTRKLTEFAKMCCICNTSPKHKLWTSVTLFTLLVFVMCYAGCFRPRCWR